MTQPAMTAAHPVPAVELSGLAGPPELNLTRPAEQGSSMVYAMRLQTPQSKPFQPTPIRLESQFRFLDGLMNWLQVSQQFRHGGLNPMQALRQGLPSQMPSARGTTLQGPSIVWLLPTRQLYSRHAGQLTTQLLHRSWAGSTSCRLLCSLQQQHPLLVPLLKGGHTPGSRLHPRLLMPHQGSSTAYLRAVLRAWHETSSRLNHLSLLLLSTGCRTAISPRQQQQWQLVTAAQRYTWTALAPKMRRVPHRGRRTPGQNTDDLSHSPLVDTTSLFSNAVCEKVDTPALGRTA